eukprot:m.186236 g.186236  ORF g.186236 m.186236 type:complete len:117 (-) comp15408_c0_seq5:624-974(-)
MGSNSRANCVRPRWRRRVGKIDFLRAVRDPRSIVADKDLEHFTTQVLHVLREPLMASIKKPGTNNRKTARLFLPRRHVWAALFQGAPKMPGGALELGAATFTLPFFQSDWNVYRNE